MAQKNQIHGCRSKPGWDLSHFPLLGNRPSAKAPWRGGPWAEGASCAIAATLWDVWDLWNLWDKSP